MIGSVRTAAVAACAALLSSCAYAAATPAALPEAPSRVDVVGERHLAERVLGIEAARAAAEAAAALALQESAARAAEAQAVADLAAAQAAARAAAAGAKPAPASTPKPTPAPRPAAPLPPPGGISPAEIPSLTSAGKAVVVTAPRYGTSHATATAWQRDPSGGWQVAHGPVPARLGWNGFAENRVRNSGTTPVGVFTLGTAFGPGGDPGTGLPWRQFDGDDWWVYDPADPATFNTWQHGRAPDALWRPEEAERLADYGAQYAYAAVINFNIPVVSTQSGGGIFLHVNGAGATAGCVSLRPADLLTVLRWLDGSARIAMGPAAALRGR